MLARYVRWHDVAETPVSRDKGFVLAVSHGELAVGRRVDFDSPWRTGVQRVRDLLLQVANLALDQILGPERD